MASVGGYVREPARRLTGRAGKDPHNRMNGRDGDERRRARGDSSRRHVTPKTVAPLRDSRSPDFPQPLRDTTDASIRGPS